MIIVNEKAKSICNPWALQKIIETADKLTDVNIRNEFLLSIQVGEKGEQMQNLFLEVPD